jgi:hypothetical protein
MAVEAKRGCGYRKVGGLYMVGGGIGIPCDRLPFELTVCTCCGQGIKQARGWTWIDVGKFFNGPHLGQPIILTYIHPQPCGCSCPLCRAPETLGRAGLLWIGEKFYKTPAQFVKEGVELGFSRRIKAVPQGFKIGETYIMLAHSKAILVSATGSGTEPIPGTYKPGIFYAWLPQTLEKIVLESQRGTEEIAALEKRGIVPVFVPDNDKDHQGNVHDDLENEKREEKQ